VFVHDVCRILPSTPVGGVSLTIASQARKSRHTVSQQLHLACLRVPSPLHPFSFTTASIQCWAGASAKHLTQDQLNRRSKRAVRAPNISCSRWAGCRLEVCPVGGHTLPLLSKTTLRMRSHRVQPQCPGQPAASQTCRRCQTPPATRITKSLKWKPRPPRPRETLGCYSKARLQELARQTGVRS
jgi:hypothetical protein